MPYHNLAALQGIKKKYILTEEEFYNVFGDYSTGFFVITEADGGRTYHLLSTGESFTVMDDIADVKLKIKEYLDRKVNFKSFKPNSK
jgi:hypothetical protein